MEPGLRDREYAVRTLSQMPLGAAAMEPGLRDREYWEAAATARRGVCWLQWSPVLETGNTRSSRRGRPSRKRAAMEPGLRDREYGGSTTLWQPWTVRCNGARS